ncbi:MAG: EamA family transporter, partial [Pseudomonadota bacterium]
MLRDCDAGFVGLANYLTPVWAVLMGAAIFGEPLTARLIGALALILAGV